MKIPVYLFTRPSNVAMFGAVLSFGAWAFPSFGVLRKGFEKPAALDPVAILILAAWYAFIFVCFRIGEFFGTPRDSRPAASFLASRWTQISRITCSRRSPQLEWWQQCPR